MKLSSFLVISLASLVRGLSSCDEHGLLRESKEPVQITSLEVTTEPRNLMFSFSGIALLRAQNLDIEIEVSVLGIQMRKQTFELCTDAGYKSIRSGLRTTSDEPLACSVEVGEIVSGTFRIPVTDFLATATNFDYRFRIFDGQNEACVEDEALLLPSIETSFATKRFNYQKQEVDLLWAFWLQQHGKALHIPGVSSTSGHYQTAVLKRKQVFEDNLHRIAIHNINEKHSYKLGMNQFGHLTPQEFKKLFASGMNEELMNRKSELRKVHKRDPYIRLPTEVNWVKSGAVTPVKNQGICGSCWSFAATGALEGAYFLSTGKLVSFSEQELVSCDQVDLGCQGGAMQNAWEFAEMKNGLCTEDLYPYTAENGIRGLCNTSCSPVKGSAPTNIVNVGHDEVSLLDAVAKQPVAVAIEADEAAFQFYTSGVITAGCSNTVDHGVLAVGYGFDEVQGIDYWLVKNSWGPYWGIDGYVKIERGAISSYGGECGILTGATYPEL